MIGTHLTADLVGRLEDDFKFKKENVNHLIDEVILADGQKLLYDRGITALETAVLEQIEVVNKKIQKVVKAYKARIEDDCKSDLFWRVAEVDLGAGTGGMDVVTLECTRLKLNYDVFDTHIEAGGGGGFRGGGGAPGVGIGSTVAFVGSTGIVTYYPVTKSYGNELVDENYLTANVNFINDHKFGFSTKNKFGLKIYSEPFDKDIGDTLVSEFVGICTAGLNEVIVMEDFIGIGNTIGAGQLIVCDKPGVIFPGTKVVGIGTTVFNLRKLNIPGITTNATTVGIVSISVACGFGVSAPDDEDGNFVDFRILDDPPDINFDDGRKRYDIPFDKDPFTPQTISIATTSTIGTGISVYIDNSGHPTSAQSWDRMMKGFPVKFGGQKEPKVGAGKALYRDGFDHAPIGFGGDRVQEGDTLNVQVNSGFGTDLSSPTYANTPITLYEELSSCSTAVNDAIDDAIAAADAAEAELNGKNSDNLILLEASNALRTERNGIQLGIHGMRRVLYTLNEELDRFKKLQKQLKKKNVSDVVE
jgi:hypothetical protein